MKRIYQLSLSTQCHLNCFYCSKLGVKANTEKSNFDFTRSLKKALNGEYQAILFPCNVVTHPQIKDYMKRVASNGLTPILQVQSHDIKNHKDDYETLLNEYGAINILYNLPSELTSTCLSWMEKYHQIYYTWIVTKNVKVSNFTKFKQDSIINETDFYFPYKRHFRDAYLKPSEIYQLIKKVQKSDPRWNFRPPRGIDIFDERIVQDMDLEPMTNPIISLSTEGNKDLQFSIILPSYNNGNELTESLKALSQLDYLKTKYEIIVIDDGSTDHTKEKITHWLKSLREPINLKVFHFPRFAPRKPGDSRFRAGIARNMGVKNSRGHYLAFLDADIIVPPNYLKQLELDLSHHDVVQIQRHHLKKNIKAIEAMKAPPHKIESMTYAPDRGYWKKFYQQGQTWNEMKAPWKYICTYGLALSSDLFKKVGWIRKVFLYYGFEDTDLGYRLFKHGCKFYLSDVIGYHQFGEYKRNEYSHSHIIRQELLSKTAKVFFHNNLDPDIFDELYTYMGQQRGINYWLGSPRS